MTSMYELFSEKLFADMVNQKYVRIQKHPTEPLFIANYAEKAVYEREWNDVTLQCRGLIYNERGEIVARPWKKFFNLGEYGPEHVWPTYADGQGYLVEVTDKMDGSLGILYQLPSNGQYAIATRGSFASEQAIKGTEILHAMHSPWAPARGLTYLFEIIYPSNRIVLDYGTVEELVLLGGVDIKTGRSFSPKGETRWPGRRTKVFSCDTLTEAMAIPPRSNAEGIVVRFVRDGLQVKLKQADYVAQHAIVTGCTNRSIWECLSKGESLPEKAAFMPDELHAWMKKTANELSAQAFIWRASAMEEFRKIFRTVGQTRKEFAEIASQSPLRAALFKLYDGQSVDELAWKAVRPVEIVRPFAQREDSN